MEEQNVSAIVAPQLRIKIKDFGAENAIDVITQGWVHGCFAVVPELDFELTTWQIVHQPSGYRFLAAQHPAVLNQSLPALDICAKSIEKLRSTATIAFSLVVWGIATG